MLNWIQAEPWGFSPHSYVVSFSSLNRCGRITHQRTRFTARKPMTTTRKVRMAEWAARKSLLGGTVGIWSPEGPRRTESNGSRPCKWPDDNRKPPAKQRPRIAPSVVGGGYDPAMA